MGIGDIRTKAQWSIVIFWWQILETRSNPIVCVFTAWKPQHAASTV